MHRMSRILLSCLLCLLTVGTVLANDLPVDEHLDDLKEAVIHGQDGWQSNLKAIIQTQVNATSGGKALQLLAPDAWAQKTFFPQGQTEHLVIDMMVRLDGPDAAKSPKLLIYLNDAKGKTVMMFFHDEAGRWGLRDGAGQYAFAKDTTKPQQFGQIRMTVDFASRTAELAIAEGANWKSLIVKRTINADTENFATLRLVRNGQGDPSSIYVDQIRIHQPQQSSASTSKTTTDSLEADTPDALRYAIFQPGQPVRVVFDALREKPIADVLHWQLTDWMGKSIRQGDLAVSNVTQWQDQITLTDLPAGYYKLAATMQQSGMTLRRRGSRPDGMISFGVLPDIKPMPLKWVDDSHFGIYGTNFIQTGKFLTGDPYHPLYPLLGVHWVELSRRWMDLEPDHAGQFIPPLVGPKTAEDRFKIQDKLGWIVTIAGSPKWAIQWPDGKMPEGKMSIQLAQAYPPVSDEEYTQFITKVAQAQVARRANQTPWQRRNYYHIHHEPDWHWKGTDEQFIQMYKVAHTALHAADPDAVLLGPRYGVVAKSAEHLERLLPMGLGQYLDGLSTHVYYLPPRMSVTPEQANMVENLRKIRKLMQTYMKPDALWVQSEWGTRYDLDYDSVNDDTLKRHAMVFMRGHLICLGEGMDVTYMFYTSDYGGGEGGYGMTFNLNMPNPNFGATAISPKPTFMAAAAMTRLLEGSKSLGALPTDANVLAYQFKRGDQYVLAAWCVDGSQQSLSLHTEAAQVQHIDLMGNQNTLNIQKQTVTMTLDGYPSYCVSRAPFLLK